MGSLVVPVINGMLEMICHDVDPEMEFKYVSPASWRKTLGIIPDRVGGKKDFKAPTKRKVEELVGKLPTNLISNITGKLRALPTDLPDSMAIACSISFNNGIKKIDLSNTMEYNSKYIEILKENIND